MKKTIIVLCCRLLVACGDEEEPTPTPQERCAADGVSAFIQVDIDRGDEDPLSFSVASNPIPYGLVGNGEVQVEFGEVDVDGTMVPLHLRIVENKDQKDILDLYSNAIDADQSTLSVFDASNVDSAAAQRSNLDGFDCGIEDGNQCVQLAFDSTDEDVISDADLRVHNGTSGTLELIKIGSPSTFRMNFDVALGSNILTTMDASSGQIQGCIDASYRAVSQGQLLE